MMFLFLGGNKVIVRHSCRFPSIAVFSEGHIPGLVTPAVTDSWAAGQSAPVSHL